MFVEEQEFWKPISKYENYEVSNLGKVKNKNTGRILRSANKGGYCVVGLSLNSKIKTCQVHRLVALAFIPNPENKAHVNHKDKNGLNNRVENLEWNTPLENNIHKSKGIIQTTNQNMKIYRINMESNEKIEKYDSICEAAEWLSKEGLAKNTHSARTNISNAIRGISKYSFGFLWKVEEQIDLENEIWKEIEIKDFECKNYYISSLGRFKNSKGIIMKDYKPHHSGYIIVRVNKKKFALHRLVAMNFIPNENKKPFVNHIDGNKTNNRLDNLNWVTCYENIIHNHNMGFVKYYTKKIIQYDLEMNEVNKYNSIKEASNILNIRNTNILGALKNRQKTAGGFIFKYLE